MKYFKHETNTDSSETIAAMWEGFGLAGYGMYFRIIELIAAQYDKPDFKTSLKLPTRVWAKKLHLKRNWFKRMLNLMSKCSQSIVIKVETIENMEFTTIDYPIISKYQDEYRRRISGDNQHKVESNRIEENRIEKNIKPPIPPLNKTSPKKNIKAPGWLRDWFRDNYPCHGIPNNWAGAVKKTEKYLNQGRKIEDICDAVIGYDEKLPKETMNKDIANFFGPRDMLWEDFVEIGRKFREQDERMAKYNAENAVDYENGEVQGNTKGQTSPKFDV